MERYASSTSNPNNCPTGFHTVAGRFGILWKVRQSAPENIVSTPPPLPAGRILHLKFQKFPCRCDTRSDPVAARREEATPLAPTRPPPLPLYAVTQGPNVSSTFVRMKGKESLH